MNPFDALTQFRVEISEHIALVTMNNPPVNAQGRVFHEEAALIFDTLSDMAEVRVAVLTGAGKCFSAGADIKGDEADLGAVGGGEVGADEEVLDAPGVGGRGVEADRSS